MLNSARQPITAAKAVIDAWLSSPWTREPIQRASSGLPVQMLSARNAIKAARPKRLARSMNGAYLRRRQGSLRSNRGGRI